MRFHPTLEPTEGSLASEQEDIASQEDPALNSIEDGQVETLIFHTPRPQGAGVPDGDFEFVSVPSVRRKVSGQTPHRLPGRRIKDIEDPAVAKKLSRFSSEPDLSQSKPVSRARSRVRGSRRTTEAPESASEELEEDTKDTENSQEVEKVVAPSRGRVRQPPSLRSVVAHRFRGQERRPAHPRRGSEARSGGNVVRQQRIRIRPSPRPQSRVPEEKIIEESGNEAVIEESVNKVTSSPRRIRPRPAVGQSTSRRKPGRGDTGQNHSTAKPRSSHRRGGSSAGRRRHPVGGSSTSAATTLSTTTTTVSSTTTTEKVTINPDAHKIAYTLEDFEEEEETSEAAIIELDFPDYLELEDDEIADKPIAEQLRSTVPVPGDVFSQATHQLMKSQKQHPALRAQSFRPTLLPRRSTNTRAAPTASRFKPTTNELPEVLSEEVVTETVQQVIQEFVEDFEEKEEKETQNTKDVPAKAETIIVPAPAKRGRFILAIGANG